jgi:hypothetical protein
MVEFGARRCALQQLEHWSDKLHGAPPAFNVIAGQRPAVVAMGPFNAAGDRGAT